MRVPIVAGLLILAAAGASTEQVDLKANQAGRVSLKVTASPLSEVLDRLARQTGMKVVYDGAPPRTVVRYREVEDVTPAEAVANVLEGLGVSYALRLDATGTRVDTLLVLSATKSGAASSPRPTPPPVRLPGVPNVPLPMDEDEEEDVPVERAEEAPSEGRAGRGEERPDITRPGPIPAMGMPVPGPLGIPGMTAPALPATPVGPLSLPVPSTMPTPSPPPS